MKEELSITDLWSIIEPDEIKEVYDNMIFAEDKS
jgi:hypothetical protein